MFIGVANTQLSTDLDSQKFVNNNNHFKSLMDFCTELNIQENLELEFYNNFYEDDNHASLCVAATNDGLRKIFSWYNLDVSKPTVQLLTKTQVYEMLNSYNKTMSKLYKEDLYADEKLINELALNIEDSSTSFELLKMNLINNPESFNAHFSIGLFYKKNGNIDSTKYYLKKAIDIEKDTIAIKLLKDLDNNG
ncbi:hypothetical protein [Portibacter lacus]|uniref:hypothetical protein n=1 Tax=Portibacter lacus TaxID=1099794 RepID=UPI001F18E680|nr:hypothetical protein [Portibacter lacus]